MATFGIKHIRIECDEVERITISCTEAKARAEVWRMAHEHGTGHIQLFKQGRDGFEFVGEGYGLDTSSNENLFCTPSGSYGYDARGRLKPLFSCPRLRGSIPEWH